MSSVLVDESSRTMWPVSLVPLQRLPPSGRQPDKGKSHLLQSV